MEDFGTKIDTVVKLLQAVPWTKDEEAKIMNFLPTLSDEESSELLARICNGEEYNYPNVELVKQFVAKLLMDFSSRERVRRVLDKAFSGSLKKNRLMSETEAIQRLNLHTAMTNGRHLLWLAERMIKLRVAEGAVEQWSEQASLTVDLQRAFKDDAWRNIIPGLPTVVLRCTSKLANAMATGVVLAARQVRMKFVKDWFLVLIVCKDNGSPMVPGHKSLYLELEKTLLQIISTLPMSVSKDLLLQCLSFSTCFCEIYCSLCWPKLFQNFYTSIK